jgi:ABC-type lipoprotein release transport system permease subunit
MATSVITFPGLQNEAHIFRAAFTMEAVEGFRMTNRQSAFHTEDTIISIPKFCEISHFGKNISSLLYDSLIIKTKHPNDEGIRKKIMGAFRQWTHRN